MLWSRVRGVKQICTVLPSSTITGVGGGARIRSNGLRLGPTSVTANTISVANVFFDDTGFVGTTNPLSITGCTFSYSSFGNSADVRGPVYQQGNATYTNCVFHCKGGSSHYSIYTDGSRGDVTITNCKFIDCFLTGTAQMQLTGSTISYPGSSMTLRGASGDGWIFDNCVIAIAIIAMSGARLITFRNYNRFTRKWTIQSGTTAATQVYLISGGTLSFYGNTDATSTTPVSINTQNGFVRVVANTKDTTPSGTFTIITTSGNTITVSGEGTYLNSDGTHNIS